MDESAEQKRHFDIAIIGGGFAGVYCARRLEKRIGHLGKKIGLIAQENHMVFQPMLPEVVGGSLSPRHVVNPIRLLCDDTDVLKGEVRAVDLTSRTLQLDGGYFSPNIRITFDHLVIATGSEVDLSRMPGMAEHAYLMRNAGDAMKLRAAIISRMEEANLLHDETARRRLLSFVVVGGGYSGVETAGQMMDLLRGVCHYYDMIRREEMSVTLIHSRDRLLPTLDDALGDYTRRVLEKNGVRVLLEKKVRAATAKSVLLDDGTKIEATTIVCTVGNGPHALVVKLGKTGALPVDKGKIIVSATGRVMGCDHVWAAGDCCAFPKADGGFCPDTAQFALREGEHVAENIAATIFGHSLEPFTFPGQGELAVIGHRSAVASVFGVNFSGFLAWFFWRTLYLMKLPGLDRKLRVMAEWTMELFFPRDINLLTPRYSSPLEEMHLEAGDPLFHAGEPAFSLYAVKAGRVDIVDGATGELVKSAGAGDHFGERALLEDRVWHFDAIAREPTTLVAIEARTFHKLIGCMDTLDRLFKRSARQYAMPDEVDRTVAKLSENVRTAAASDIMTRDVVTLSVNASLTEALALFQSKPHSLYPVLDEEGRLLGALRRKALYDWMAQHRLEENHTLREIPPSALMQVSPADRSSEILEDLIRTGASKAAVVDDSRKLLGILSLYDLVRK